MSYLFNRLKEQASNLQQQIAKNIIVYENKDANNENESDEEVLDQIHDGGDVSQLQGKEVIKSKPTTTTTTKSSSPDISKKQGSNSDTHKSSQSLNEQQDDFFNSFIPNLQQKAKMSTTQNASKSQEIDKPQQQQNKEQIKASNGSQQQQQKQSLSQQQQQITNNTQNSKSDNNLITAAQQDNNQKKQSIVANKTTSGQNKNEKVNQNNNKTSQQQQNQVQQQSNYKVEELEEKIRFYKTMLDDNENTIETFRQRVISLEQELSNLKDISSNQQQNVPPVQNDIFDEQYIQRVLQERDQYHQEQMRGMLEVIQQERQKVQERDSEIEGLHRRLEEISNYNHQLKIANNSKIQDIENILNNLVQTATSQLELKLQQLEQEKQSQNQQQQQQLQVQPQQQQQQQQQPQVSPAKGKKGKKNQQKQQLQQQLEQQMKEKLEQEQQQQQQQLLLQEQQQKKDQESTVIINTEQPLDTITPEQLQQVLQEILQLLKPTNIDYSMLLNDDKEQKLNNSLMQIEQNNQQLREINLQISDKMLSLEQIYHEKLVEEKARIEKEYRLKIEQIEQEYKAKSDHIDERIIQIVHENNQQIELKVQEAIDAVNEQYESKIKLLEQEYETKILEINTKNADELQKLQKLQEEIIQQKAIELEQQNKSWETNYQKIQEQNKQESLEIKKHILNQVHQELSQTLNKTFDLIDIKLPSQQDDVERLINNYANLIKDNFKSGQQLDPLLIKAMKDTWDQVCERFNTFNLQKYQKQASKDSQQWLSQRVNTLANNDQKKKSGGKQQESFKDSDLYKFYDLQLQTILSLNQYITDQTTQLTDITSKRDTLQSQLSKLQKDCSDLNTKQKDIPKLQQKVDQLTQEKEVIQNQLSEVLQQKLDSQMKLEEGRNKTEMLVVENATLKEKVGTIDEETKRLRKQNKQLQGQLDLQEDFKLQHEKAQQELKWMETQLKSKENELDESRKTLSVLQRSLQNQQEEYDNNLRLKEREQQEDKQLLQSLQLQNNEMKEKIREVVEMQNKLNELQGYSSQLEIRLEKLESENQELKKYSQELVEKVKKDSEANEYMVDRRMINKFLVNYVNPNSSREVKFQMLDSMSRILGFTMEEKQTLGLVKKQTLLDESGTTTVAGAGTTQQNLQKGIGEKLISFFLQDDDDDE